MRALLCFVSLVALALRAQAQNINIDFGPLGSSVGTAPATYAGPALSPGAWNSITSSSVIGLLDTAGVATGVGLTITTFQPSLYWEEHDFSSAPHEALLDDYLRADWFDCTIGFSGLAPGNYAVYTVSLDLSNIFPTQVSVPGSPDPLLYLNGVWNGGYVLGSTSQGGGGNYSRQTLNVTNGTLQVYVYASGFADQIMIQGLQLVRLDPDVLVQCPGDGTQAACPCSNSGQPGRGCENSATTGGARLAWSGNTAPDTLVLAADGLLPTAPAIFFQGDATIAAVPFGDGLRCTGGVLKRLYVKTASAGMVSAPQPGDPSITQRSASLGDPISIGELRYYQVYYRDPSPGFCAAGSAFNVSQALRVVW